MDVFASNAAKAASLISFLLNPSDNNLFHCNKIEKAEYITKQV
jgi:hypothetical protein